MVLCLWKQIDCNIRWKSLKRYKWHMRHWGQHGRGPCMTKSCILKIKKTSTTIQLAYSFSIFYLHFVGEIFVKYWFPNNSKYKDVSLCLEWFGSQYFTIFRHADPSPKTHVHFKSILLFYIFEIRNRQCNVEFLIFSMVCFWIAISYGINIFKVL